MGGEQPLPGGLSQRAREVVQGVLIMACKIMVNRKSLSGPPSKLRQFIPIPHLEAAWHPAPTR